MDTIYVHVRHWLFWYGVYGLCAKSCNDEVTLYSDKEKTKFLGHFDLLAEPCLIYSLNNELDKVEDKEYFDEMEEFLSGNKDISYSYIYPRDNRDISSQVDHYAPLNDKGHKPIYIYMWSKLSKGWDVNEIEKSVKILASYFLHMNIDRIEMLEIPTYEETKLSYEEDYAPYI
ncbi:hypothetical protein YDYSY3_02490 [Paenibacillus chitinolyticus]|uniref:hypothetical protein n=1 Tax=Paenibacillus chitinolyticus TaxID=79263 RepID=UPI0026E4F705|nr:hypothetical protein [Paenibacillus chitinolyticus]GKS09249.1 hypothetical protein YDYSY3_02490 [Paenibacillus chitinolyticus]